jgi:hypothetical protein
MIKTVREGNLKCVRELGDGIIQQKLVGHDSLSSSRSPLLPPHPSRLKDLTARKLMVNLKCVRQLGDGIIQQIKTSRPRLSLVLSFSTSPTAPVESRCRYPRRRSWSEWTRMRRAGSS